MHDWRERTEAPREPGSASGARRRPDVLSHRPPWQSRAESNGDEWRRAPEALFELRGAVRTLTTIRHSKASRRGKLSSGSALFCPRPGIVSLGAFLDEPQASAAGVAPALFDGLQPVAQTDFQLLRCQRIGVFGGDELITRRRAVAKHEIQRMLIGRGKLVARF